MWIWQAISITGPMDYTSLVDTSLDLNIKPLRLLDDGLVRQSQCNHQTRQDILEHLLLFLVMNLLYLLADS